MATPGRQQEEPDEAPKREEKDGGHLKETQDTGEETQEGQTTTSGPAVMETGDVDASGDDVTCGGNDVKKPVFPCPTCRAAVEIPEGGVVNLQVITLTHLFSIFCFVYTYLSICLSLPSPSVC